jgi:DNA mismatch endonuclease (patch repair protein)
VADVFSVRKRSEIMSRVKSRGNKATELRLVEVFRTYKIKGWRRRARLFGNPDFIFPAWRLAVFVDGCFWHGCPTHGEFPKTNRQFWHSKLARNKKRDRLVNKILKDMGWKTLRFWQHDLNRPEWVVGRLSRLVKSHNCRSTNISQSSGREKSVKRPRSPANPMIDGN